MPQNSLSSEARFIGGRIDELDEILSLLRCQFDELLGLTQNHPDLSHHMTMNWIIYEKVKVVSDTMERQFKTKRSGG